MTGIAHAEAQAALPCIVLDDGAPYLRGWRCRACAQVGIGEGFACPACGARNAREPIALANTGVLHSFSIVYRSFPDVITPFIAAVVDLDGGGALQGTLIDMAPDPARLAQGLRVQLVYRDTGQRDDAGMPFIAYFFAPLEGDHHA